MHCIPWSTAAIPEQQPIAQPPRSSSQKYLLQQRQSQQQSQSRQSRLSDSPRSVSKTGKLASGGGGGGSTAPALSDKHRRALALHKKQAQKVHSAPAPVPVERRSGGSSRRTSGGSSSKKVHPAAAAAERRITAPTAAAKATATTRKGLSKSNTKSGSGSFRFVGSSSGNSSGSGNKQQPKHVRSPTVDTSNGVVPVHNIIGPQKQAGRSVSLAKGTVTKMSPSNGSGSNANSAESPKQGSGGVSFRRLRRGGPHVDAGAVNAEYDERHHTSAGAAATNGSGGGNNRKSSTGGTPRTDASTPASNKAAMYNEAKTPAGVRGRGDLRSPGVKKTPISAGGGSTTVNVHDQAAIAAAAAAAAAAQNQGGQAVPIPDFITQTDKYGNATTPRSADAIAGARKQHPTGPEPHIHVTSDGKAVDDAGHELHPHEIERRRANEEEGVGGAAKEGEGGIDVDPCDALLESLRMMCCCLVPEDSSSAAAAKAVRGATSSGTAPLSPGGTATVTRDSAAYYDKNGERTQYSTRESQEQILYEDAAAENQVKLLPAHHPDDLGKKCLVLDLDETLVHSSFRAVPGADFVIPVQIEDVVHFVYVMKRPGVDEFLVEMAKHYEIVVYTASLNKYADPLLDLLDPQKTIRTRLFRESCVYYEGNYVKDLR